MQRGAILRAGLVDVYEVVGQQVFHEVEIIRTECETDRRCLLRIPHIEVNASSPLAVNQIGQLFNQMKMPVNA